MSDLREHKYFTVFVMSKPEVPHDAASRRRVRSHPRLDDRDWLLREYVQKSRSSRDMASELGVTTATVLNALRAAEVPRRRRGRPSKLDDLDIAWLREQYVVRHRSAADIGRELSVSEDAVLERMHAAGLRLRPRGGKRPRSTALPRELNDAEWLRERYSRDELSIRQIAGRLGVSSRAVWNALVRANVPRRAAPDATDLDHRRADKLSGRTGGVSRS